MVKKKEIDRQYAKIFTGNENYMFNLAPHEFKLLIKIFMSMNYSCQVEFNQKKFISWCEALNITAEQFLLCIEKFKQDKIIKELPTDKIGLFHISKKWAGKGNKKNIDSHFRINWLGIRLES